MGTKSGFPFLGMSLGLIKVIGLKTDKQEGFPPTARIQYGTMVNWSKQPLWRRYGKNTPQNNMATVMHRSFSIVSLEDLQEGTRAPSGGMNNR